MGVCFVCEDLPSPTPQFPVCEVCDCDLNGFEKSNKLWQWGSLRNGLRNASLKTILILRDAYMSHIFYLHPEKKKNLK